MTAKEPTVTQTERKIGKVTYIVCSSSSKEATETIENKIKKMIKRDLDKQKT